MSIKTDITLCHMPTVLPVDESKVYHKLLRMHCENKTEGHKCLGTIAITAHTMTLQCPLCGDVRKMMAMP